MAAAQQQLELADALGSVAALCQRSEAPSVRLPALRALAAWARLLAAQRTSTSSAPPAWAHALHACDLGDEIRPHLAAANHPDADQLAGLLPCREIRGQTARRDSRRLSYRHDIPKPRLALAAPFPAEGRFFVSAVNRKKGQAMTIRRSFAST